MKTLKEKAQAAWEKDQEKWQEKKLLEQVKWIAEANVILFDKLDFWKEKLEIDDIRIDREKGEYVIENHIRCSPYIYYKKAYDVLTNVSIHGVKLQGNIVSLENVFSLYKEYDKKVNSKDNTYRLSTDIPIEINEQLIEQYIDFLKKQIK